MKAAALEEQKERIRAVMARWRAVLTLDEWEIDLNYRDGEYVKGDGNASARAIASTDVQWEYRRAQIYWRCDLLADESDDELESIFVHEAMHVLLNGQRAMHQGGGATVSVEYERLFEEHTATTLARAFIRASRMAAVEEAHHSEITVPNGA